MVHIHQHSRVTSHVFLVLVFFCFLVDAFVWVFNYIVLSCCHYGVIKHDDDDDDDDICYV